MIVKQNRMILLLAAVLLLAQWLMPVAVSAAEPLDPNRDCELTISLNYQGKPVSGASYNLYRVADVSETGKFTICAPFTDYPIEFSDMTTEKFRALAQTLDTFIKMDRLSPDFEGVIDENGFATVTGLKPGLYLLLGQRYIGEDGLYESTPCLIAVPTQVDGSNDWVYNVTVLPKCTFKPHGGMGVSAKKVLKIWEDTGNEATRPKSIQVILLCNGEPYDTVELNAENGWSYVWLDLPAGEEWLVVEVVPDGYRMLLEDENLVTQIVNTNDSPPSPPPPTEPPDLPPTGMLWWPMPVLIVMGLVFIVVGLRLNRRNRDEA